MATTSTDDSPQTDSVPPVTFKEASSSNQRPASPTTSKGSSTALNANAPSGHALRRARTSVEGARSTSNLASKEPPSTYSNSEPIRFPRRSSNFSEYSFNEARNILNPQRNADQEDGASETTSSLAALSLVFALLPALAGVLFHNGSAVVTDIMLLALAGIFLHWSVTQPWAWYHSAQEVRVQNEQIEEAVLDDDSDYDVLTSQDTSPHLEDVPEESSGADQDAASPLSEDQTRSTYQHSALHELYLYEILALFSCFIMPLISAYLLHAIRSQLSRPSEGLVSNYNLTIFLLVSEMRVASHLLKLLNSRTLHLQRIVQNHSASSSGSNTRMSELLERVAMLEAKYDVGEPSTAQDSIKKDPSRGQQETHIARDVRNAIQPELDALNRAVRRYEKKATLLQLQTESRFSSMDARMDDAIALAAAAAKNQANGKGFIAGAADSIMALTMLPFNILLRALFLPLSTLIGLTKRKKTNPQLLGKTSRGRNGSQQGQQKWSSDRVPSRMSKR